MAIFERGETYTHWATIRDRNNVKTDPSSVKIYIYDPCGNVIVDNQSMTKSSTGVYYFNYNTISSSATYGKYETKVVAKSATGQTATYISHFYVMPYKYEQMVRDKFGIAEEKDIDDDALSEICWSAYKKVLRDVYIHVYKETPSPNPDTGALFDGTNTSFQTCHYPIADINGDGEVSGTSSCATDIWCWWIDKTGSRKEGYVSITNADNGEISLYQSDGATAIPSDNEGVYLEYWYEYENYDNFILNEAVTYLAAHYLNLRLTSRDKITLADINKNKPVILLYPSRYWDEYRKLLKDVTKPRVGGA